MSHPTKPGAKSSAIDRRVKRFRAKMAALYHARQDEAQQALLGLLCDSYARYLAVQAVLRAEGEIVPGWRGEKRRHPGVLILRDCRIAMVQLYERLEAGRDHSQVRIEEADAALEEAISSGPRICSNPGERRDDMRGVFQKPASR